jgi:glycosyltransferase involved in cell wall biosynthesis
MRITFFVGRPDLGGGARVISIYAERLQRRGHEVTVFARPPRTPTLKEKFRHVVRGRALPADTIPSPSYFQGKNFQFKLLDRYRPATAGDVPDADAVIATWWETAEWVSAFPASKGAKVYFVQHHEVFAGDPSRINATWQLPMHKITVAQWLSDLAAERFGDGDTSLVPNAVDLEQFSVPVRGKQATPTVGVMYSTVHFKGCDVSLAAFGRAAEQVHGLRLVSFGAIQPNEGLPLPEGSEFVFQPPQDRIRDLYGKCDAWLFGSRSEGFGLPLLEAMACRTPVIATPAGAAPELVARGGGILVPQEDPDAMAAGIVKVCRADEAAWRQMSDNAFGVASRYTWDDATDRFEAALKKAIEKGRSSRVAA